MNIKCVTPYTLCPTSGQTSSDGQTSGGAYFEAKKDSGKPDFSLLPAEAYALGLTHELLEGVVRVLEFGKEKYDRDSWRKVPDAELRYLAAAQRHRLAIQRGEEIDPESKLPHVAHFWCNVVFLFALGLTSKAK